MEGNVFTMPGQSALVQSVSYGADGSTVLFSQKNSFLVKEGGTFRGETGLLEVTSLSTVNFSNAPDNGSLAGKTIGPIDVKSYVKTANSNNLGYGYVTTSTSGAVTSYFTPATTRPSSPALNTPYRQTYSRTTEATSTADESRTTITEVVTYLGIEQISLAAGTFSACKTRTETTSEGASVTRFQWNVAEGRLKGLGLLQTDTNGKKALEATVVQVNGQ